MRTFRLFVPTSLIALMLALPAAHAGMTTFQITLDTATLANNLAQGPFAVDFQLDDGSTGDGIGNNTATITNFSLTGGSLTAGTGTPTNSVSGSLGAGNSLTLTDNGPFNDFNQQFAPGSSLSFTVDLTTNVSASEGNGTGNPDQFAFLVYSNNFGSTASQLLFNITGPNLTPIATGGTLGNNVAVAAPSAALPGAVAAPEPSTLTLLLLGLASLAARYGWRFRLARA